MTSRILVLISALCGFAPHLYPAAISLTPTTTSATVGGQFSLDVQVTGLGAGHAVSGFDLDLLFDPSILAPSSVVFNLSLGDPVSEQFTSAIFDLGRIDFASISFLDNASLLALQTGDITLARIAFNAIGPGTSSVLFDSLTPPGILLLDLDVSPFAITGVSGASAAVSAGGAVPEPRSLILLTVPLLWVLVRRRVRA